jgi:NitT/TauT family transport system permease protein
MEAEMEAVKNSQVVPVSSKSITAPANQSETKYRIISILSPLLVLVLWETLVRTDIMDRRFFPAPTTVIVVLAEMIQTGELFDHLFSSLQRIIAGFILGAIPAIILGMLMGWSRGVRAFLDPIVAATYPVPKLSLLPLIIILFGIGEASKIVVVAIAGFFIVLITTAAGVRRIDPTLLQAAHNYGAQGWKLFSKVILPASLPAIFTGLRLALGTSLLIIVAAEFVAAKQGIGYLIWLSWSTLSVGEMYAGLVVIAVLGLLFTTGLERLGKRLMPWAEEFRERSK